MDNVLQTEVFLNLLNTVLAKAVHFKDEEIINKISALRHEVYYGDFNYEKNMEELKEVETTLKKYE